MGKVKVSKNNNTKKIVCSVAIAVAAALIIFAFCGRFFNLQRYIKVFNI